MKRRGRGRPAACQALLTAFSALLLVSPGVGAQADSARDSEPDPPRLSVSPELGTVVLHMGDLLQEGALRDALVQGLPLRILVDAQLWKDRFFDSQEGRAQWRASVVFDPLDRTYRVRSSGTPLLDLDLGSLEEAQAALQQNFQIPLQPESEGRYYYLTTVLVETLSLSDLEELERWLRGDLAAAVRGEEEVEGAVARGFRRIFVRVLGLPTRRFELRTRTFDWPGRNEGR